MSRQDPTKGPQGPKGPRIEINWSEFEKLCALHCTLSEIAEWFSCSEDTIERAVKRQYKINFAEVLRAKSGRGKISLRRLMWQKAEAGSVTMQIWLSKQMLGHKDRSETDTKVSGAIGAAVDISVETKEERIKRLERVAYLTKAHQELDG